jgi:hypothetical protein
MSTESASQGIQDATAEDIMKAAWNIMNQAVPLTIEVQKPLGRITLPGGLDPREIRIESLSSLTVALTSCLNMVMVAWVKEHELKMLPRAERRRRMN